MIAAQYYFGGGRYLSAMEVAEVIKGNQNDVW